MITKPFQSKPGVNLFYYNLVKPAVHTDFTLNTKSLTCTAHNNLNPYFMPQRPCLPQSYMQHIGYPNQPPQLPQPLAEWQLHALQRL
jgi:hypothetical protein